jgi:hypothetical protein
MNNEQEQQLAKLAELETKIAKGIATYSERNTLIVRLVESGVSQAEVTRRLNAVRKQAGVATITPDAVAATMRRVYKAEKAQQ